MNYYIIPNEALVPFFQTCGAQIVSIGGHPYCISEVDYQNLYYQILDEIQFNDNPDDDYLIDYFENNWSFIYWSSEVIYQP